MFNKQSKEASFAIIFNPKNIGEILSISRKDNVKDFGIIGGKVEIDEKPDYAMMREVFEETGVRVIDFVHLDTRQFHFRDLKVNCYLVTSANYDGLNLGWSPEGVVNWLSIEELINDSNSHYEYNKEMIVKSQEYRKNVLFTKIKSDKDKLKNI